MIAQERDFCVRNKDFGGRSEVKTSERARPSSVLAKERLERKTSSNVAHSHVEKVLEAVCCPAVVSSRFPLWVLEPGGRKAEADRLTIPRIAGDFHSSALRALLQ